jgi:2-polyprenyl-3-methyl-5-hydroxy-6-metoxy-1,4-benzoquinol methylase
MLLAARSFIEAGSLALPIRFLRSDVFSLEAADVGGRIDLIVCLGLIAHTGRLDTLLSRLKALLIPRTGKILLQTSLADHWGVAVTRAISARFVSARTGYKLSYFRHRDICNACKAAGLKIINIRRHTFGIPFGDRIWPRGNYWVESQLTAWANRHGAEALYLIAEAD